MKTAIGLSKGINIIPTKQTENEKYAKKHTRTTPKKYADECAESLSCNFGKLHRLQRICFCQCIAPAVF